MNKIFLFIILVMPAITHAAYIAKNKVGMCPVVASYGNQDLCQLREGSACIEKLSDYNCAYHVLQGNQIIIDANLKAAYDAEVAAANTARAQERTARIAKLAQLRNTLDSLDGPLDAASIRAFIKALVVEEIRRLKQDLE